MAEWLKAHDSKSCDGATRSEVRILSLPPDVAMRVSASHPVRGAFCWVRIRTFGANPLSSATFLTERIKKRDSLCQSNPLSSARCSYESQCIASCKGCFLLGTDSDLRCESSLFRHVPYGTYQKARFESRADALGANPLASATTLMGRFC